MFDLLYLLVPVILAIFGYPVFGRSYGEKWEVIRQISMLLMTIYFWMDMSMRLAAFSEGEYRFYKSSGAKSEQIVLRFASSNLSFLYLWGGVSFVCIYDGRPAENTISWLQMLILMAAAALIIFEILHLRCRKFLGIGGICVAGAVFVLLIVEIANSGANGMNGYSLSKICNTYIMLAVKRFLLEINLGLLIVVSVAFVAAAAALKFFDDKVIDPFDHKVSALLKLKKNRKENADPAGMAFIEAKRVLRMKMYLIVLIFEFIFAALGIAVYFVLELKVFGWLYFFAVISGLVSEALFVADIPSKLLYRVLGAEFRTWYKTKYNAVIILGIPLLVVFLVSMLVGGMSFAEFLLLMVVFFGASFCLCSFYAYKYLKLKYRMGAMYLLETMLIIFTAVFPLLNIGVGYILFSKAGKRWNKHVGG